MDICVKMYGDFLYDLGIEDIYYACTIDLKYQHKDYQTYENEGKDYAHESLFDSLFLFVKTVGVIYRIY